MTGLGQSSPIAAYQDQANSMWRSHDENGSIQMNMYSLGVMDLDLSISPDVFGLRAFDAEQPVTRMLPGSSPCELRLMLPDDKLGIDGFHDVLIENLSATPTWRSSHVAPADMTSLRRRWPKAVFNTLRRPDMPRNERTRRSVTMDRVFVASVIPEYIRPWTPTWWHTIWSWDSCGAALSHGVRCVRGRVVPVWSIWRKNMVVCRGRVSGPGHRPTDSS